MKTTVFLLVSCVFISLGASKDPLSVPPSDAANVTLSHRGTLPTLRPRFFLPTYCIGVRIFLPWFMPPCNDDSDCLIGLRCCGSTQKHCVMPIPSLYPLPPKGPPPIRPRPKPTKRPRPKPTKRPQPERPPPDSQCEKPDGFCPLPETLTDGKSCACDANCGNDEKCCPNSKGEKSCGKLEKNKPKPTTPKPQKPTEKPGFCSLPERHRGGKSCICDANCGKHEKCCLNSKGEMSCGKIHMKKPKPRPKPDQTQRPGFCPLPERHTGGKACTCDANCGKYQKCCLNSIGQMTCGKLLKNRPKPGKACCPRPEKCVCSNVKVGGRVENLEEDAPQTSTTKIPATATT